MDGGGDHTRFRVIPASRAAGLASEAWHSPDFEGPDADELHDALLEEERRQRAEEERERIRRQQRRRAVKARLRQEDEARRALPTTEEIEALREEARRQGHEEGRTVGQEAGYQQGYAEGLEAGRADGRRSGAALVHRMRTLLDTLGRPLQHLDEQTEEELVHLIHAVARQVLLRELRENPDQTLAAVRQALGELPANRRHASVYVHSQDLPFLQDHLGEESGNSGWSVLADDHLTPGGCVVTTEISRVDATVERRMEALAEELLGDTVADAPDAGDTVEMTYRSEAQNSHDAGLEVDPPHQEGERFADDPGVVTPAGSSDTDRDATTDVTNEPAPEGGHPAPDASADVPLPDPDGTDSGEQGPEEGR